MDPLSIATGCITLITVVGNCARWITDCAVSFKDARKELAAVSRELSDLDMTLHILKDDAEPNRLNELPEDLCQRICDIIQNCNSVLDELKELLNRYDNAGLDRVARWALSGRKDVEKIRLSLNAHKEALGLVVEATTLRMITAVATDTKTVSKDTSLIKEYTMKIVEQLAKQDEILEQIAWIRAVVSQRSTGGHEGILIMDKYLDGMTDYTGSVCGDSVTDDVADEMRQLSMDAPTNSTALLNPFEPSPILSGDTPESMTIVIGNTHRLVTPKPERTSNKHLWSFYLQTSGEEIIHEVRISLHPTFTPPELLLRSPPYRVTRIGWGYFTIDVIIVLEPGYRWHKGNSRTLRLEWQLDFDGFGSSASYDYAVTVERGNVLD